VSQADVPVFFVMLVASALLGAAFDSPEVGLAFYVASAIAAMVVVGAMPRRKIP
jgi:uncharacterized membrane protein AbrB (regulator of aidB expression)